MAEFFERIGQRPVRSESAWWHEVQPRVMLSFPYHRLLELPDAEVKALFREHRLRALRYPAPLAGFGFPSTLELNTNPDYDLSCMSSTARRQTKQGLRNCAVEPIDFDDLVDRGLALNKATADRQGRDTQYMEPAYWRQYCQAAKATPGFSVWGAMIDGELAAYLISVEFDGWVNCLLTNSSSAHLAKRPNNALLYVATRHFLRHTESKRVCYGLGSLEHLPELDRFKIRMGWTLQPIKQRLIFSTSIRCAFALAREPCLRLAGRLFPKSYTVRKTVGMIRLYRQQSREPPGSADTAEGAEPG